MSQIAASFVAYGKHTRLRQAVIYGGVGQGPQVKALQHGSDVIIATPGRLLDLMNQGHVDLEQDRDSGLSTRRIKCSTWALSPT